MGYTTNPSCSSRPSILYVFRPCRPSVVSRVLSRPAMTGLFRMIRTYRPMRTGAQPRERHSDKCNLQELPCTSIAPHLCCTQPAQIYFWSSLPQVFLLKTYSWASEAGKGGSTDAAKVEQQSDRRALETCNTLLTRRGLESTGAVPCVSPECGNWMVPEGGGQRVKCTSCLIEFCGR